MKNKYHIEGIGKNKKIREQRKLPIPLSLMKTNKCNCGECGKEININKNFCSDGCLEKYKHYSLGN